MVSANLVGRSADEAALLGEVFGGYRLVSWLGAGGEGQTFRAVNESSGGEVALKVFRSVSAATELRVRREFERLAAVAHPSIVRVIDLGRRADRLFLVTELLVGAPLSSLARRPDGDERRAAFVRVAREIVDAVAYLHGRGFVHGDISPANILLANDGRAVLIDLGALGMPRPDDQHPGGFFGTLGFAAPEALVGQGDPVSDLFSLGATLFFAWTGTAPLGLGAAHLKQVLTSAAPRLSSVRAGLSPGWDGLMAELLERDPARRPRSARMVLKRIDDLLGVDTPSQATHLLPPYPVGDPLAGVLIGRQTERERIVAALDHLAAGRSPYAAIAVVGPEGMGRRTVIRSALQSAAIRRLSRSAGRGDGDRDGDGDGDDCDRFEGSLEAMESWLTREAAGRHASLPGDPGEGDPARAQERRMARLAEQLESRAREKPICVCLDAGPQSTAFARLFAGAPASGRSLVLLAAREPLRAFSALDIVLERFSTAELAELVARATELDSTAPLFHRVVAISAGVPAVVAHLVRQWIVSTRDGSDGIPLGDQAGLDDLLRQSFAALPTATRRVVARVFCGPDGGEPDGDALPGLDLDAAISAGWIMVTGADRRLSSGPHARVVERALADADLQPVARATLTRRSSSPLDDARAGYCFRALSNPVAAARAFRAAAGPAVAAENLFSERAVTWLEESRRSDPGRLSVDERLFLVSAMATQGRTVEALEVLEGFPGVEEGSAVSADEALRSRERAAWLLARTGALTAAFARLAPMLIDSSSATAAASPRTLATARARLSRILFSMGRFDEACALATQALGPDTGDRDAPADTGQKRPGALPHARQPHHDGAALALETIILASAYAGRFDAAREWLARARGLALSASRLAFLSAFIEHLAGDLETAAVSYRNAFDAAEGTGDIHTLAAISLNLGALAAEAGRYDEALAKHERAIRELGRLGATSELSSALFNAGVLLIELGDLTAARAVVGRLRAISATLPVTMMAEAHRAPGETGALGDAAVGPGSAPCFAAYLEGALAARAENPGADEDSRHFEEARRLAHSEPRVRRSAALACAEALARQQRLTEARVIVAELATTAPALESSLEGADIDLARARIQLSSAVLDADEDPGLPSRLALAAELAERDGRRPMAWRFNLAAARLLHRRGQLPEASRLLQSAGRFFEEVRMSVPVDHRSGFGQEREARFLSELADLGRLDAQTRASSPPFPATRGTLPAEREDPRLRRLLRINKRLNSELRLPRLLELVLDTVIELTEAERGFILLDDENGELVVKLARNMDQQSLTDQGFELSQSIARQAASGGQPIVTIDAGLDPRFQDAVSVSDLHLRSVLAVPLHIKGRAVGTIYVDNRLRKGAFGDHDVQLVLDFSEQAAIAIENARMLGELRRRERQIAVLNRRLEEDLSARKEELSGLKVELRENREALAIRHDYRSIVGRTPRMLDLFRMLDRLTDTALPVVIQGESGTGKELVARALHFNGARKRGPFVSENCAAIPETLLESTLFGSVKGAYTGADHDSRGLFEIADGGTLFLDEVGEMSPSMQGKLLRVLQTGELRRVGSEKTRKVDVRIIAATNRELDKMVEEGRFRQDLFFRLCVARIALPPLRERREDIPAIVEHVLAGPRPATAATTTATATAIAPPPGHAAQPQVAVRKHIDPSALARLVGYRWPGNVRELENELMRASALCQGSRIAIEDLSPHIVDGGESTSLTPQGSDDLAIRPRVERLERSLVREALARHTGNQTRAAEALGLSRFGLQKKLKRYRMG